MNAVSSRLLPALALAYALPASAILLDCKKQDDGTYLCVEIEATAAIQATPSRVPEIDKRHLEQARSECTYRKPRRRMSGMGAGGAVRTEARKAAQQAYERCVADRARELRTRSVQESRTWQD